MHTVNRGGVEMTIPLNITHHIPPRLIGHLDEEGFLTVTGRSSDLIKLDTDEVVHVTPMEQRVRLELACVSQCVIVPSPARDSLGLIITLDTIADDSDDFDDFSDMKHELCQWISQ